MSGKTILLTEDDVLLRNALTQRLTREGFNVQIACNGEECLRKGFELRPDLILLDLLMPKLGGMEVLKKLRSDPWGKTVKVLILTNMAEAERLLEEHTYRSDGFLIKSDTNIGALVAQVEEQLDILKFIGSPVSDLPEYRCACGKLLFKGMLLFSTIEIKCKRCGEIRRIDNTDQKLLG